MCVWQLSSFWDLYKCQCSRQFCDSNLVAKVWEGVPFCSRMTMPLCTEGSIVYSVCSRTLTSQHKAQSWTSLNTYGMIWNADCTPRPISQNQCLSLLCVNWNKSQLPCFNIVESLYREVEAPAVKEIRNSYYCNWFWNEMSSIYAQCLGVHMLNFNSKSNLSNCSPVSSSGFVDFSLCLSVKRDINKS